MVAWDQVTRADVVREIQEYDRLPTSIALSPSWATSAVARTALAPGRCG